MKSGISWKIWILWIAGVIILGGGIIGGLNYYSGVEVRIIPKSDSIPFDEKITAVKTPKTNELSYAIIMATSSVSREVTATEEKAVTAKASGKILVYNTQLVQQRLIKNTRFQSPENKIYRINDSINIPKATVVSGKTIPGNIEVTIYADEAGPDFNSVPTDFTVPGLKGSKIFDMVYARSNGPISGGASGVTKSVSDEDLKQASEDLRIQLETKLRSAIRTSLAPSQIAYDSGIIVELGEIALPNTNSSASDKAVVSQEGTVYLLTFNRVELTQSIVKSLIPTYAGESVAITNLESLEVLIPKITGDELWKSETVSLGMKGTPSLEWSVNEDDIKNSILGIPKNKFNEIMVTFPTVERAIATIHPIWKTSFPANAKDITIKIVTSIDE